ncbi:MAG: SDR family oxidoreductase [Solirubrobacterales bacterium]|nr:SDR family oxidoreductase [Solirubrobacterales bacterium]
MAKAPRSLVGTVVAITGGARGIGRATAAALIAQGAKVAIGDLDAALAARTADELGHGTVGLALDVTNPATFETFVDQVEAQLGPLDVLINNAGIMPIGPFTEESDETARALVDINLNGVIVGSKLALRRFLPRGHGHLVNIASAAGKAGFPGGATYCATKHGVVGLSAAIRAEVRDRGIGVSVVMPTVVHTELGSGLAETRSFKAVEPEDVAAAIVDALQRNRYEVFVPRSMGSILRPKGMLPIRVTDAIGRLFKSDQVLMRPDHVQRAAYEARVAADVRRVPSTDAGNSAGQPLGTHASDDAVAPESKAPTGTAQIS